MESHIFQGVLWKRRDIFKNRWRPRWFVLQSGQGVLTYYLLVKDGSTNNASDASITQTSQTAFASRTSVQQNPLQPSLSTPLRSRAQNFVDPTNNQEQNKNSSTKNENVANQSNDEKPLAQDGNEISSILGDINIPTSPARSSPSSKENAFDANYSSHSSNANSRIGTSSLDAGSVNTVDYDVVPRGAMSLLGCIIMINDELTRVDEDLYAFSIIPPNVNDEGTYHLATRTAQQRDAWVEKLNIACKNISTQQSIAETTSNLTENNSGKITAASSRYDTTNNVSANISADVDSKKEKDEASSTSDAEYKDLPLQSTINVNLTTDTPAVGENALSTTSTPCLDDRKSVSECGNSSPNTTSLALSSSEQEDDIRESNDDPSIFHATVVLILPLVLFSISKRWEDYYHSNNSLLFFFLSAYWSIRYVVLLHLGPMMPNRTIPGCNPITMHFIIDSKDMLRHISKLNDKSSEAIEVSAMHLVISAIGKAMKSFPALNNCCRICIPFLCIDGYFKSFNKKSADISLCTTAGIDNEIRNNRALEGQNMHQTANPPAIITLQNVDNKDIQNIAKDLVDEKLKLKKLGCKNRKRNEAKNKFSGFIHFLKKIVSSSVQNYDETSGGFNATRSQILGQCLILDTPDSDHINFDFSINSGHSNFPHEVNVVATIGGMHSMEANAKNKTTFLNGKDNKKSSTKDISPIQSNEPILSLSLTVVSPICDLSTCHYFAEKVKKSLQFLEADNDVK